MHSAHVLTGTRSIGSTLALTAAMTALLSACTFGPGPTPELPAPSLVASASPTAQPSSTPQPTSPPEPTSAIGSNGEGCPAPLDPISFIELESYDVTCFTAGVTVAGWWQQAADGSLSIGLRRGSISARSQDYAPLVVTLKPGHQVPARSGYGSFFATSVGDRGESISNAVVTSLPNPAMRCPTASPIPIDSYLDSLVSCYRTGQDVTVAGWRSTPDICSCGQGDAVDTPAWLTSPDGFGWIFPQPFDEIWHPWLTLYAPHPSVLGADSRLRPTWMEVSGHFDDARSATCRETWPDGSSRSISASCAAHFVVAKLRETAPPDAALGFCPKAGPDQPSDVIRWPLGGQATERLCLAGGEVSVVGWYAQTKPTAGGDTTVSPEWLDPNGAPNLFDAEVSLAAGDQGLPLFVDPATSVTLPAAPGWYLVTGHFGDPAAAHCTVTDDSGTRDDHAECSNDLVVTSFTPEAPNTAVP